MWRIVGSFAGNTGGVPKKLSLIVSALAAPFGRPVVEQHGPQFSGVSCHLASTTRPSSVTAANMITPNTAAAIVAAKS